MRTLIFVSLVLLPFFAKAQKVTELRPKAVEAAVYQGGAVVTHRAEFDLRSGIQSLRLTGFPENINLGSIQISTTADYEMTGLRHEVNRSADGLSPQGRLKRDSLDAARYQLKSKAVEREALEEESAVLKANREIRGEEKALSVAELEGMASFIRSRVADIRQRALDISQEEASIDKRIKRLERELAEMRVREVQAQREIIVDLKGRKAARSNISVSYLTNSAAWIPHHDLRSEGTGGPLEIVTRAKVQQHTGVNWTDVQLTLVTGNPNLGGAAPVLQPWYLHIFDPSQQNYRKSDARYRGDVPRLQSAVQEVAATEDAETVMPAFEESRRTLQTAYELNLPYSITGDNQMYSVEVRRIEVPVTYRHRAVPKSGQDVFLTAELTDWDAYNLLPGEAMVYFEGNLAGRSYLDPAAPEDTMQISMGRDRNVRVSYELAKDYSKTRSFGSNRRVTRGYNITVMNAGAKPVTIRVEDQVPLSSGSNIEVEVKQTDGARLNTDTGVLTWDLDLSPGENRELGFRYEVTYPKKMRLGGL